MFLSKQQRQDNTHIVTADTLCSVWDYNFVCVLIRGGGYSRKNSIPENSSKAFKVFAADWLNDFHWTRTPCLWRQERRLAKILTPDSDRRLGALWLSTSRPWFSCKRERDMGRCGNDTHPFDTLVLDWYGQQFGSPSSQCRKDVGRKLRLGCSHGG